MTKLLKVLKKAAPNPLSKRIRKQLWAFRSGMQSNTPKDLDLNLFPKEKVPDIKKWFLRHSCAYKEQGDLLRLTWVFKPSKRIQDPIRAHLLYVAEEGAQDTTWEVQPYTEDEANQIWTWLSSEGLQAIKAEDDGKFYISWR